VPGENRISLKVFHFSPIVSLLPDLLQQRLDADEDPLLAVFPGIGVVHVHGDRGNPGLLFQLPRRVHLHDGVDLARAVAGKDHPVDLIFPDRLDQRLQAKAHAVGGDGEVLGPGQGVQGVGVVRRESFYPPLHRADAAGT